MDKPTAFERFFKENYSKFCFFALRYVNDEDACRDIVSSGFEHIWKNDSMDNVAGWRSYMLSYIHNKCVDHIRHESVHKKYAEFYLAAAKEETAVSDGADERIALMGRLIDTLTAKTRLVLQECFVNGKSYKEVAAELEIGVSTVHKHISKALKTLREGVKNKQTGCPLQDTKR